MTEAELRELDIWIVEKFLGWERLDFGDKDIFGWANSRNMVVTWGNSTTFGGFSPSSNPLSFALVKREIERRGWGWRFECDLYSSLKYQFDLFIPKGYPGEQMEPISEWGETEEIAGCLAVKAEIEGIA